MEGKPEAPVRGGSVRADEGSGLCPRVHGAGSHGRERLRFNCPKPQASLTSWTDSLTKRERGRKPFDYSTILFYALYRTSCIWHRHSEAVCHDLSTQGIAKTK